MSRCLTSAIAIGLVLAIGVSFKGLGYATEKANAIENGAYLAAEQIGRVLKYYNVKKVCIYEFHGFPNDEKFPSMILGFLKNEFTFTDSQKAEVTLSGTVAVVPAGNSKGKKSGLHIQYWLTFRNGDSLKKELKLELNKTLPSKPPGKVTFPDLTVTNPDDVLGTGEGPFQEEGPQIVPRRDSPNPVARDPKKLTPFVDKDTRLMPHSKSAHCVEVLVAPHRSTIIKKEYRARSIEVERVVDDDKIVQYYGVVRIKKNEAFALRLYNKSKYECVARCYIDGLPRYILATRTNKITIPSYDGIPPGGKREIWGWYNDNKSSEAFKMVDFRDSIFRQIQKSRRIGGKIPVKDRPKSAKQGTIVVVFRIAAKKYRDLPFEGAGANANSVAQGGIGAGSRLNDPVIIENRYVSSNFAVVAIKYIYEP